MAKNLISVTPFPLIAIQKGPFFTIPRDFFFFSSQRTSISFVIRKCSFRNFTDTVCVYVCVFKRITYKSSSEKLYIFSTMISPIPLFRYLSSTFLTEDRHSKRTARNSMLFFLKFFIELIEFNPTSCSLAARWCANTRRSMVERACHVR